MKPENCPNCGKFMEVVSVNYEKRELKVPNDKEIHDQFADPFDETYERWCTTAVKWAIKVIKERNE